MLLAKLSSQQVPQSALDAWMAASGAASLLLEISQTNHLTKLVHFFVNITGEIDDFWTSVDERSLENASKFYFRVLHTT